MFDTQGKIISSRFNAYSNDVVDGSWSIKLVDSTRRIAKAVAPDLQAIAFGPVSAWHSCPGGGHC